MYCKMLSWAFVTIVCLSAINNVGCTRIIGGRPAREGELPYQVGIRSMATNRLFCGGSIISPVYVLTAAHCVGMSFADLYIPLPPRVMYVMAGQTELKMLPSSTTRNITQVYPHANYTPMTHENDIALLKLQSELHLNPKYSINAISMANKTNASGSCLVSGWGIMDGSKTLNNRLYVIDVPLINRTKCSRMYDTSEVSVNITDGMLCSGLEGGGKDSCQGDSGGPLVCDGALVGIVSFGYGCALPNYPGVYTEVAYFGNWTQEAMKQMTSAEKPNSSSLQSISNILMLLVIFLFYFN